jgi:hypothetical protein
MIRASLCALCFILLLSVWVIPAESVPIADATGHSNGFSATVNFAVLSPGDPFLNVLSPIFQPGEGVTAGLRHENYTYLYQITNRASLHPPPPVFPPPPLLAEFSVRAGGPVTTTGTFVQSGFHAEFLDYGHVLGVMHESPCTFPGCRIDGPGGSLDGTADFGIAIRPNAAHTPFVTNSSSTSWQFFEPGAASHTTSLYQGTTSSIVGYQSPHPPLLGLASISYALSERLENISGIAVPSSFSAPEPGTLSVLAFGVIVLIAWRTRGVSKLPHD